MNTKTENAAIVMIVIWLLFAGSIIIGWIMNIFDVIGITTPLNAEDALHIVGIFIAPLGAIMGFFF